MGWLDGQVAIVTGGGSGLGRALVERFIVEGARVGVLEISERKVKTLLSNYPEDIVATTGDATTWEANTSVVQATLERFGKLDVFVGNAGIWDYHTPLGALDALRLPAAFDELFALNVKGQLLGARATLDALRTSRGSMTFTLSNAAFAPGGGGPLYTASKHALVGLVRQLAYELAPEIRVNGVAPGGMATDLRGPRALGLADRTLADVDLGVMMERHLPLQIACRPSDYTGAYVLLSSREHSRATTGSIYLCDGGMTTGSMHGKGGAAPEEHFGALADP